MGGFIELDITTSADTADYLFQFSPASNLVDDAARLQRCSVKIKTLSDDFVGYSANGGLVTDLEIENASLFYANYAGYFDSLAYTDTANIYTALIAAYE